jgi:Mrp family chromosome partitioning ATPase
MTPLDQAFIKAYRRGIERPRHERILAPRPASEPTSVAATSVAAVTVSPAHPTPPAPARFPTLQHAAPAAPLSSFTARPAYVPLEPAFQVPHFVWPTIVDELMSRAAAACSTCGAVLLARSLEQRKVLLVTSGIRGIGCSTVSLVLARSAAMRGSRVVLIDLDVRHPRLADMLGINSPVSWDAGIDAGQPLHESLIESALERLTLMPLIDGATCASTPNLAAAINILRDHYDLVVLDAGPLDNDAATIDLAALVLGSTLDDGVIVRDNDPSTTPLTRRLAALGISRWQTVENFVSQA